MSPEMDFLPVSHRVGADRRRERKGSFLLAAIVGCGILLTEAALRLRVQSLRSTRHHASLQAEVAAQRSAEVDNLRQRQSELIQELAEWCGPLETKTATEVLDGILTSRPASIRLHNVNWNLGPIQGPGDPALQIGGALKDLGDLVAFLTALEQTEGLPRMVVRRSSMSGVPTWDSLQTFMVESVSDGEVQR